MVHRGADNGTEVSDGYNVLLDAQKGLAWYSAHGFTVNLESPAGLGHNLSGMFGTVLMGHLDDHLPNGLTPTTTVAATPGPIATQATTTIPTTAIPTPMTTTAGPPATTTTAPAATTTTAPPPAIWKYTLTPTRVGAQMVVTIPSGISQTTFQVIAAEGRIYVYNYTTKAGPRTLSIVSSLAPNTTYNYTLEADDAVVGSRSFRTLP